MNKVLFLLVVLLTHSSFAQKKFYEATISFQDGTSKTGLAESFFGGTYIAFKSSNNSAEEKLETSGIKGISYKIDNEIREYHQLKTYLGWGQKRIGGPTWLQVIEKGIVTLYVKKTTLSGVNQLNSAGFLDYYCIRPGEEAAKWISAVSTMNNNAHFKAKAPLYFEDYPELAAKIKSKEHTWKDIVPVVQEYNKWAANQ